MSLTLCPTDLKSIKRSGFSFLFKKKLFIWNRQRKRSFSACGAAVKLHFNVLRPAAEKPTWTRGRGHAPQASHPGPRFLEPLPSFRQRQVCYVKDVILPHMCTYAVQLSAISLPLLGRQIRVFSSLFQIKYRMYLGSQTVYSRM